MSESFVLAYDLGTSGVKGAIVSTDGELIASCTAAYPLYTPRTGWAEQNPEDYWAGVCNVTRRVLAQSGVKACSVAGISFGTMWKGIVPIDSAGRVLHNSIIWLDARANTQAERLNERFGKDMFVAADYWPKLLWLREEKPDIVDQAAMILETNSYLKWKATGVAAVDISNSFTKSFDPKLDQLYEEILSFIDIPREKFPSVVRSDELVGYLTAQAADELELIPGIPVFGGCNDIQAVTVGAGTARIGGVHIYFGSSGWIGYTIPHVSQRRGSPFDTKRDISLLSMQAIGLSFNWIVNNFYSAEVAAMGDEAYTFVNKEVEKICPGSDGVFATPWFYGERAPLFGPDAKGNFLNLGPKHDRRYLARAIMEGVCYHLKMQAKRMEQDWPDYFSVVGGGSCSDVWMQILADVLDTPVRVPPNTRHAGAIGTAYSALIGLGVCSDYNDATTKVRIAREFHPRPEAVAVYEKNFAVFEQLYAMLKPMFSGMNSVEKQ